MTGVVDIDAGAAEKILAESGAVLLDVREDDEWDAGHAPEAVHVKLGEVVGSGFRADGPVVVVCRSGNRSRTAAAALIGSGLTAYNLAGGMAAWQSGGRSVVRDDGTAGTVI
ncbi:MAG: rhodanese-like domain-containing protein [Mycobacterium sp.]|nr:rhodanese-like domain-containing protein [Mycobacterium sp.]